MCSGSTVSASRCSPTSRRWCPECARRCWSSTGPNIRVPCRYPGAHPFKLAPLCDSHINELINGLLGTDPSVPGCRRSSLSGRRACRSPPRNRSRPGRAGRTRGRAGRLRVRAGGARYPCPGQSAGDHRSPHRPAHSTAKRTLNAAAVIGARFDTELLETLLDPPIWRRWSRQISSNRSGPPLMRLMRSVIR